MAAGKTSHTITERQFREIWQLNEIVGRDLVAENGEIINIVYPGRPNDGQGADFRDAVIVTDGKLSSGDVEFHLRSGDWRAHHHHLDSVYNRVVLHVVMHHNTKTGTVLQNGSKIPILVLGKHPGIVQNSLPMQPNISDRRGVPCRHITKYITEEYVGELLDRAGEERFLEKSTRFYEEIIESGAGATLYRGIMVALGYSGNKDAFLELAGVLPLELLEMKKDCEIPDEEYLFGIQTLLLGTAGFLTENNTGRLYAAGLDNITVEKLVKAAKCINPEDIMPSKRWRLFRIRPCNSPVRRLMAMSYLLLRYRNRGLLERLLDLADSAPETAGHGEPEKGFIVTLGDIRGTLLGKSRAEEITVNILLPFVFACGVFNEISQMSEKALKLFRDYPRLETNSLVKHMAGQLGLEKTTVNTVRRQQGLIHIYNSLCTRGRCEDCELSNPEAG